MMQHPCYTNEELVNTHLFLIYDECHKNERMAAVLYANRFPDKRHLTHALFGFLFRRICQYDFTRQHVHETYPNA